MTTMTGICPIGNHPFSYELKGGRPRVFCSRAHQEKAAAERATAKREGLTERRCPKCKAMRPTSEFSSGSAPYCKKHMAEYTRNQRTANPDRLRSRRESLARYGLTPEEFDVKLAQQDGKCAICGSSESGGTGREGPRGWHVDHDHACCNTRKRSCGKCFRGLLCSYCNTGLGSLRDNPVIVRAALDYLLAYQASRTTEDHEVS
jgi:hypothetical protein